MTSSSATSRLDTHEVTNQATPLCDYNTFDSDPALQAAVEREGAKWAESRIRKLGAEVGSAKVQELASLANKFAPELFTNDRYGHRLDEVEYHPAYHELMSLAFGSGIHSLAWTATEPGGHVARAAMSYLWNQGENGIACPIAMTYAALPAVCWPGCTVKLRSIVSGKAAATWFASMYCARSIATPRCLMR